MMHNPIDRLGRLLSGTLSPEERTALRRNFEKSDEYSIYECLRNESLVQFGHVIAPRLPMPDLSNKTLLQWLSLPLTVPAEVVAVRAVFSANEWRSMPMPLDVDVIYGYVTATRLLDSLRDRRNVVSALDAAVELGVLARIRDSYFPSMSAVEFFARTCWRVGKGDTDASTIDNLVAYAVRLGVPHTSLAQLSKWDASTLSEIRKPQATPPQATPPQATPPQATPPQATPPQATPFIEALKNLIPNSSPHASSSAATGVTNTYQPGTSSSVSSIVISTIGYLISKWASNYHLASSNPSSADLLQKQQIVRLIHKVLGISEYLNTSGGGIGMLLQNMGPFFQFLLTRPQATRPEVVTELATLSQELDKENRSANDIREAQTRINRVSELLHA